MDQNTRRHFLQTVYGILVPVVVVGRPLPATSGPLLVFGGRVAFIGVTFIVTEIITGVLRAYDISIARSIEQFMRAHQSSSGYRPRMHAQGMPSNERIVAAGRSDTGVVEVGKRGYITQVRRGARPVWTPSINMWAATGEQAIPEGSDLIKTRCGYPITETVTEQRGDSSTGYARLTQNFERGRTSIIIDHSKGPATVQNLYERNKDEEVWLQA